MPWRTPRPGGPSRAATCSGFSLLETLVATAILAAGVLAAAQLLTLAAASNVTAIHATRGTLIAVQKLEGLRACCPEDPSDLPVSPPGSLEEDTPGSVDYLDWRGQVLAGGPPRPAGTVYTRRWSVAPHQDDPTGTLVLQVIVTPHPDGDGLRPADTWLVGMRTLEVR